MIYQTDKGWYFYLEKYDESGFWSDGPFETDIEAEKQEKVIIELYYDEIGN